MSDFHLGYSDDALPQCRSALEKAVQVADVVIAAGDLFDVRIPKQETVNEAVKLFKQHSEAMAHKGGAKITKGEKIYGDNPAIAIHGTHERRTKGLVNVVEMLDSAGVLVNCHNKHVIVEKNGERVAIMGMGGVPEEYAGEIVKTAGFKPLENCFNIFAFHQTLKEVIPMAEACMSMNDLPPGFDLYVNGHIHWRREIKNGDKLLLIPGSTVITQMKKNEVEKKGFWLFDTITKNYEFAHIESRQFFYKEIYLENATVETVKQEVEKAIAEVAKIENPLVKIKLRGSLASGITSASIDANALAASFKNSEVYIDKEFEMAETLKEKIELIRKLKTQEKSVSEIGIAILKEKLKKKNFSVKREEELFSLLSEGEIEKTIALLKSSS